MMMNDISCAHSDKPILNLKLRWFITLIIIVSAFFVFKSFIIRQLLNKAISYHGFGMHKDAIRQYSKVLLLDRDNEEALNWMAYSCKKSGNNQKAIDIYKKAISFNPKNYFAYLDLGLIYVGEREFEKAKDIFYQVSLTEPDEGEIKNRESFFNYKMCLHWLATIQIDYGETNKAIETYREILKYDSDDKRAKIGLKELLKNSKRR